MKYIVVLVSIYCVLRNELKKTIAKTHSANEEGTYVPVVVVLDKSFLCGMLRHHEHEEWRHRYAWIQC